MVKKFVLVSDSDTTRLADTTQSLTVLDSVQLLSEEDAVVSVSLLAVGSEVGSVVGSGSVVGDGSGSGLGSGSGSGSPLCSPLLDGLLFGGVVQVIPRSGTGTQGKDSGGMLGSVGSVIAPPATMGRPNIRIPMHVSSLIADFEAI